MKSTNDRLMSWGMQCGLSHSISGVFSYFSVAEKPRATDFVDEKRSEKNSTSLFVLFFPYFNLDLPHCAGLSGLST